MCVIAGYIGNKPVAPILLDMLKREEGFAGGFFSGIATVDNNKLYYDKVVGYSENLIKETDALNFPGTIGVAHGRPDMAGGREYAHPFVDKDEKLAFIVNGAQGQYEKKIDITKACAQAFDDGCTFNSAVDNTLDTKQIKLPDGKLAHFSDAMCQLIAQALKINSNSDNPPFTALTQTFQDYPGEFVGLCLHADYPDQIVAARHNMPMYIGRDGEGGMYIASMPLAFPKGVNWHTRMAPRSGAIISRDGSINIKPFTKPGIPVGDIPSMLAIEERIVGLLRKQDAKADTLMDAIKPLWEGGELNQKEIVVYETLQALKKERRIKIESRFEKSKHNPVSVPKSWACWNIGGGNKKSQAKSKDDDRRDACPTDDSYSNNNFLVREAEYKDLQAILDITKDAFGPVSMGVMSEKYFGKQLGGKPWHYYKCNTITEEFYNKDNTFLICELDGKVVGYASLLYDSEKDIATIGHNAVFQDFQGRGIASSMHKKIMQIMKYRGYKQWQVTTLAHDYPAQKVYEKMGFEEVSRSIIYLKKVN